MNTCEKKLNNIENSNKQKYIDSIRTNNQGKRLK